MTRPLFAACVLLSASTALAQTPAPAQPAAAVPGAAPKTITMTGCVGGQGSDAQPFMLNNAFVVPSGTQPMPDPTGGATAATQPITPPPATPPPVVSPTVPPPATSTPPVPPAAPTPPSSAGAAGATSGAAGTAAAGTVGTAGTAAAAPPAVASAAMNGYRLSGSDMKPWAGQRVEIVGSLINARPAGATAAVPEFRVQSVRPMTGPCPQ